MFRNSMLILILLLCITGIHSQNIDLTSVYSRMDDNFRKPALKNYVEIEGNPYLTEEYNPCLLYSKDKKVYKGNLRYDIFADDMEFRYEDIIYAIEKENVDSILFDKLKFISATCGKSLKPAFCYFQVLEEGPYQLLLKYTVQFLAKEPPKPIVVSQPDRFQRGKDTFYLRYKTEPVKEIYNRRSLKAEFPAIAYRAEKFIKKEKIDFSKKEDIIKLTRYLNSF